MGSNAVFLDLICDQRREGRRGDRNELALFARKTGLKGGMEKTVLGELSLSLFQKGDGVDKHLINVREKTFRTCHVHISFQYSTRKPPFSIIRHSFDSCWWDLLFWRVEEAGGIDGCLNNNDGTIYNGVVHHGSVVTYYLLVRDNINGFAILRGVGAKDFHALNSSFDKRKMNKRSVSRFVKFFNNCKQTLAKNTYSESGILD